MPIRAILFDLDNTLLLEDEVTHASVRETAQLAAARGAIDAAELAKVVPEIAADFFRHSEVFDWADRFGIWWGEALWADFDDPDGAELRTLRSFAPRFRRSVWRMSLSALAVFDTALADELADAFRRIRRAHPGVDAEAESVLGDLGRDHALAIVTNGAPSVQRAKLGETTLARHFKAIAISVEVGYPKPDARIFRFALDRLGIGPSEAAMVGDSRPRDVAGARATGMRAILLERPNDPFSEGSGPDPDVQIARLSEIRAALGT